MASDDLTLQVLDMGVAYAAVAYLLLALACGVLAVRNRSRAAWLAAAGFGYMAISASLYVAWIALAWFVPQWDTMLLSEVSGRLWLFQPLALLVAAAGFAVYAFRQQGRGCDSDSAA